jgi:hypothetical protein
MATRGVEFAEVASSGRSPLTLRAFAPKAMHLTFMERTISLFIATEGKVE